MCFPAQALPVHMRRFFYKVLSCPKRCNHDWTTCAFAHTGETAARRNPRRSDPRLMAYAGIVCPDMKKVSLRVGLISVQRDNRLCKALCFSFLILACRHLAALEEMPALLLTTCLSIGCILQGGSPSRWLHHTR
jgi:hypothetical protein